MASHTYSPQAHSRAITKYTKDKFDRIEIRIPKETGFKGQVTEYARSKGSSVNAFIIEAVKKAMKEGQSSNCFLHSSVSFFVPDCSFGSESTIHRIFKRVRHLRRLEMLQYLCHNFYNFVINHI